MRTSPNLTRMLKLSSAPAIIHNAAYKNMLNDLVPSLYKAMDVVSREQIGFLPSVMRDVSAERVQRGQPIITPITPRANVSDVTESMTVPEPTDQDIGNRQLIISKVRSAEFGWTGEGQAGADSGPGHSVIQTDQIAQGFRALTNEMEADLAAEAASAISRAQGTAGTVPFQTDLEDTAMLGKILTDNGAPKTGRSLIINTLAGAKLRTLMNLTKVNEAGTAMTLRDGELLDIHGFSIKESAGIVSHVSSGTAGRATNGTAYPVGATKITLDGGGFIAGDIVSFAGDSELYVIRSVDGSVITLNDPGLVQEISAGAVAVTTTANHVKNVAFTQNAIKFASRLPLRPQEGDLAIDVMTVTDPRSGMSFEIAVYPGHRKIRYEVSLGWGQRAIKDEHIAGLIG